MIGVPEPSPFQETSFQDTYSPSNCHGADKLRMTQASLNFDTIYKKLNVAFTLGIDTFDKAIEQKFKQSVSTFLRSNTNTRKSHIEQTYEKLSNIGLSNTLKNPEILKRVRHLYCALQAYAEIGESLQEAISSPRLTTKSKRKIKWAHFKSKATQKLNILAKIGIPDLKTVSHKNANTISALAKKNAALRLSTEQQIQLQAQLVLQNIFKQIHYRYDPKTYFP